MPWAKATSLPVSAERAAPLKLGGPQPPALAPSLTLALAALAIIFASETELAGSGGGGGGVFSVTTQLQPHLGISFDATRASWRLAPSVGESTNGAIRLNVGLRGEAQLEWRNVLQCLRGRRIAFVGDSVTRYQYTNLAHFLAHGDWYSAPPIFEYEKEWPSWVAYYEGTSARLVTSSAYEKCDCVRENQNWHENRIYHDFEMNVTISFTQHFEGAGSTRGLDPLHLSMSDCIEQVGCLQGGCSPGRCSGTEWEVHGYMDLLHHVVASLRPDTLIFNSGLWPNSGFSSPDRTRGLLALGRSLRNQSCTKHLIWKTSTRTNIPLNDTREVDENGWPLQPGRFERAFLLPALEGERSEASWRVFDAFSITSSLHELGLPLNHFYFDRVHFRADIYRGLNEAFLLDLIRTS